MDSVPRRLLWFHRRRLPQHAPWVNDLMQALPDSFAHLLHPVMAAFIAQKRNSLAQIEEITTGANDNYKDAAYPTIFHSVLSSKLPEHEKSVLRLSDDAQVLMMAGTLTTAWVLELTMFWLLALPAVSQKLKDELSTTIPYPQDVGNIPLPVLEQLPYLNAVMKEGLRLTYGVSCRLARIDPENVMVFREEGGKQWDIPPGTPVCYDECPDSS